MAATPGPCVGLGILGPGDSWAWGFLGLEIKLRWKQLLAFGNVEFFGPLPARRPACPCCPTGFASDWLAPAHDVKRSKAPPIHRAPKKLGRSL